MTANAALADQTRSAATASSQQPSAASPWDACSLEQPAASPSGPRPRRGCGNPLLARRGRALRLAESRREAEAERLRRRLDAFGLTPREVTVAQLILEHRCYQNIADQLGLSPRTVQFHASNIFRKASVERRRAFEHLLLTAEGESAAPSTGPYEIIPRLRP